jgi:adenine-specific DNA-methyltransferase
MQEIEKKNKELMGEVEKLKRQVKILKAKKKYGLVFEEEKEPEQIVLDCQVKIPILKETKSKEIISDKEKPVNVLIEGDNYHSLSVLNYTHKGKVDVIYIDPPYNTGKANEWKYNDKYVDENDRYKHSKWLSFLNSRLKLAKFVLKDEGAIFISIDNNEVAQLKLLCNEIFGENNYVGTLIWRKKEGGGQTDSYFATEHEYIVVYAKSKKFVWRDEIIDEDESKYNKEDSNGKYTAVKLAKWGNTARKEDRPKMHFPLTAPDESKIYPIAPDRGEGRWRVGKKTMDMLLKKGLVEWKKRDSGWIAYEKVYYTEGKIKKIKERSVLYDLATTADGTNELTQIFGKKDIFENPKPTALIMFLLRYASDKDAIILDFFAGSGSTGHAVLKLNKEDNGNRKFILCTNNENDIAVDVCYPRIKNVIKGYKNFKGEQVRGLKGNLRYFKTELLDIDHISHVSDEQKIKLTYQAGEIIALREGAFVEIEKNDWWQIFKDGTKYTAIYFKEDKRKLNELVKKLSKLKEKVALYIFSWGKNEYKNEFTEYKNIKVEDIPEPIIDVYKEVNRLS